MHTKRWNLALGLGLVLAAALACNFNFSTANISSLKVGKDEKVTSETSSFSPKDTVYIVAALSNTSDKWKMRCRLYFDDVQGQKSGELVPDSEQTLQLPGQGTASYKYSWGGAGWPSGKYKIEVAMISEQGEEKDKKTANFTITGNNTGSGSSGSSSNDNSSDMSNMNMSNDNSH
jgi:hypothetical protein